MRSEEEIMALILDFARSRAEIRAAVLNGSRANPNAPRDPFQDYDVACFVTTVEPFIRNPEIVRFFGDILILQTPDDMGNPPPSNDGTYAYLMQFMDGNRIDLGFRPINTIHQHLQDSLTVVLPDKDGLIPELPPSSDRDYLPQRPSAKAYDDCCNEFWWLNAYVAKGLWRGELTYARIMLDTHMREQLMIMLEWYFGVQTGFQKSPGKLGKYLKSGLSADLWALLERTYAGARPDHSWQALFVMGELFRRVARVVAAGFGFTYPERDDQNVSIFIREIQALPPDAAHVR